ncbi:MAG TPA: hypothetical protein DCQ97_03765 [Chitinophagaceae bacterium]|nr:hypothetical protein [Chitinophagaceae bacterium]
MMKQVSWFTAVFIILISCNDAGNSDKKEERKNNRVSLRSDSINVVKLTDTLVIYESICRGCVYEESVRFKIADSAAVIKLLTVNTHDNSSSDMQGGNIGKELLLVPVKAGNTRMKLYKFLSPETAHEDSARSQTYTIEVKN